ncbi:hypothetical protein [Asaia astilbis]|nr:hypothetical protein [Asaia astilbis]
MDVSVSSGNGKAGGTKSSRMVVAFDLASDTPPSARYRAATVVPIFIPE